MLNVISQGADSDAPPLLIVHGLFGSGRNWGVIARRLAEDRRVLTPDMRNHGDSFRAPVHDYPAMAADLAEVIEAHGGRADVVGHSMGGKAAMQLALTRPDLVGRLVIADIAPVAYSHTQTPLIDAMAALPLDGLTSRRDADAALAPAVPDAGTRAFLLQSLDLRAEGGPRWKLNLPVLKAEMDRIIGWPGTAGRFDGPTLVLSGGASSYVQPAHRPLFDALFPAARHVALPGVGHWLHAEAPAEFLAALAAFLDA